MIYMFHLRFSALKPEHWIRHLLPDHLHGQPDQHAALGTRAPGAAEVRQGPEPRRPRSGGCGLHHAHAQSHDKDDFSKDEVLGSPSRHNDLLKGNGSVEWIVGRLHEACDQLTSVYIRMYNHYTNDNQCRTSLPPTD